MGALFRSGTAALLVRAGRQLCALPVSYVIETLRPLPVRPIEAVDSSVLGVAIIRGAPTVVIDASRLIGTPVTPARFVTLRAGSRVVALAVDAVIGVRELAAARLQPLPTLLAARSVEAIGAADAELMVVLEASHLVADDIATLLEAPQQ